MSSRARRMGRRAWRLALAALPLAIGVTAWGHVAHGGAAGGLATLPALAAHVGINALVALPVAAAACAVAVLWSRMLRLRRTGVVAAALRGGLAALFLGVLLVPFALLHEQLDVALGLSQPELQAAAATLPLAELAHATRDALVAELAALPLAVVAMLLLARGSGPAPRPEAAVGAGEGRLRRRVRTGAASLRALSAR